MALLILLMTWSHNLMAQVVESAPIALSGQVDYQSQIGRVLGMLLFVLLLIFAVVWVMKKVGYTGHTLAGPLSIKACLSLSNKEKLYVIQVGEEQLLIGASASGITPLKTLEKPIDEGVNKMSTGVSFSKKLQEVMLTNKINHPKANASEGEVL